MKSVVTEAEQQQALHRAVNWLRDEDPTRSAAVAVVGWQKAVLWAGLVIMIASFPTPSWCRPMANRKLSEICWRPWNAWNIGRTRWRCCCFSKQTTR